MTLITTLAVFYALAIAYLGFEMWRAPLVDDYGNVLQEGNSLQNLFAILQLRYFSR